MERERKRERHTHTKREREGGEREKLIQTDRDKRS